MKPGSNKARKAASQRLGLALQANYRALVEANGQEEIQAAAIVLGDTFNTNIEFIINVLKAFGGMEVKFEPLTARQPHRTEHFDNDGDPVTVEHSILANGNGLAVASRDLPDISALVAPPLVLPACACPPLEPGIIGAKHMASCPHFAPAA